jgi:AcrR family transcriptional regulator
MTGLYHSGIARSRPPATERIPPRPAPEEAGVDARERLVRTAYELFTGNGILAVGVDRIVADASVAKTTLYRHFASKDELAVATLERHDELWTQGWLAQETARLAASPSGRLVAIFDALDHWARQPGYRGCFYTNSILEIHDRSSGVRAAALWGIARIYEFVRQLTEEAGAADPERLAREIHMLMRGIFVASAEGDLPAVAAAADVARVLVERETRRP